MKDLGQAQQILGMQNLHDRKAKKLWLSQEQYVERVLSRFNIKSTKLVSTPLVNHFTLSKKSCPSTQEEKEDMVAVPYSSTVWRHGSSSILFCSLESYVYYSLHLARHCSCSWFSQQTSL